MIDWEKAKRTDRVEPLRLVYERVEETHEGLGQLALAELLAETANRALAVIAPRGTGKSTTMRWLTRSIKRQYELWDCITIDGLKKYEDVLTGNQMTLLVDDISKGGTSYSQIMTVLTLGQLCYTGYVVKTTGRTKLCIKEFRGSAIMNFQPLLLEKMIKQPAFDVDIADKVIRYYHLWFPPNPISFDPRGSLPHEYNLKRVEFPEEGKNSKQFWRLVQLLRNEMTLARAVEHGIKLCKASALLSGRYKVEPIDVWLVYQVFKPVRFERLLIRREDLEGPAKMDRNIMVLLSLIASFRAYPVKWLLKEYKIGMRRLYQIIAKNKRYICILKYEGERWIGPTLEGRKLLMRLGVWPYEKLVVPMEEVLNDAEEKVKRREKELTNSKVASA